jgi:hypothetical protein
MKLRERGASLLIPVLLVITVGAFAVVVAATQSGSDIQGTYAQADSTEALFLAETGIERATRRFLAGSACSAAGLGENLNNLATIGIAAGRSIAITAGPNSVNDFSGAALPATQCRIQATGTVTASSISRTLQAIIDRDENLIGGPLVAAFNNPAGAANPAASWTGGGYDSSGGYTVGVNPPNCTRAAYLVKPRSGGASSAASSIGTTPVSFTVNRPATVQVNFDYRIMRIGNSGSNACVSASGGGACPNPAEPAPGSPETTGNGDGQICFTLRDTAGVTYTSSTAEVDQAQNNGLTVAAPACTPTTQQLPTNADYTPCDLRYNHSGGAGPGAAATAYVRFTFAGAGTLTLNQFGYQMYRAAGGQPFEMWIDNIVVRPTVGGVAVGGVGAWRDCAVISCPAV